MITLHYGYVNGALQGRGELIHANQLVLISRTSFLLAGAVSVMAGYGLLGLGVSALLASLITRAQALRTLRRTFRDVTAADLALASTVGDDDAQALVQAMWHNASRLGLVQLGAFLIQRGNVLIASSLLGLEAAASYGLTSNLLMALASVSTVPCNLRLPRMNFLQAQRDRVGLALVVEGVVLGTWGLYVTGFAVLYWLGPLALVLAHSSTPLLPAPWLLALGLIFLLEVNHSVAATYLTTVNRIPFVAAALVSGGAIALLSLLLAGRYGVGGLIVAQGGVQLAYNNWKWPLEAWKTLDLNLGRSLRRLLGNLN